AVDGNTAAGCASFGGVTQVYAQGSGPWVKVQQITNQDGRTCSSVGVSGTTLVVGAPNDDSGSGRVHIYVGTASVPALGGGSLPLIVVLFGLGGAGALLIARRRFARGSCSPAEG